MTLCPLCDQSFSPFQVHQAGLFRVSKLYLNELIHEIFRFLNHFHIYKAFFNLKTRFRYIVTNSNLPIDIDLSSISKSSWKRYHADIIETNIDRINILRILDPCMYDFAGSLLEKLSSFNRIECLILDMIEPHCLENLLDQLCSFFQLRSLIITTKTRVRDRVKMYRQIFRLPVLKYCKLSLSELTLSESLLISKNEYSPIEHLIIMSSVGTHELDGLLSYVPQLRRLSLVLDRETRQTRSQKCPFIHKQLTHVSLRINTCIDFDEFQRLTRELFPNIEVLHLTVFTNADRAYMNGNKWQLLIQFYFPKLRIFDIQCDFTMAYNGAPSNMMNRIGRFKTLFWISRQWSFSYHLFGSGSKEDALFYSVNPYRYTVSQIRNLITPLLFFDLVEENISYYLPQKQNILVTNNAI